MSSLTYKDAVEMPKASLLIIQKYDEAFNYVYPFLINSSNKHRILRDKILDAMLDQYRITYEAAKSNQQSKLYTVDAGLAYIKELIRLSAHNDRRLLSIRQYEVVSRYLAEVGDILGSWIQKSKKS